MSWSSVIASSNVPVCIAHHANCQDGAAATHLLTVALRSMGRHDILPLPLKHDQRLRRVWGDTNPIIIYADISPYPEDLPLLQTATLVLVIDHHLSVRERVATLLDTTLRIYDLSDCEDCHCATSLVAEAFEPWLSSVSNLDDKVACVRKMDVWDYEIQGSLRERADAYRAYITSKRSVMVAVQAVFQDAAPTWVQQGLEAMPSLVAEAESLFESSQELAAAGIKVMEVVAPLRPFDSVHFAGLWEKDACILLRRTRQGYSVTRTADAFNGIPIDCGQLCTRLAGQDGYSHGGGHPFAAGIITDKPAIDTALALLSLFHTTRVPV